ncbi:hypothetical protein OAD28_02460 [Flavobacteriales bacterium]|nr:hypothetical protein [Flavobacteriales bacterium]
MKTSFIDINFSFIEKEEIISKKGLISSFEDTIGNQKIELAYRFVEEQYRERILLNQGFIKKFILNWVDL